ncbi:MAG TPA: ATP-binding cassette domain-containing protein [Acidimicrobiales bacterium]
MTAADGAARLEIHELTVGFGGLRAVDGLSLVVEPGTITGILGPNGSGKTTLLDAVSGQVRPTSGRISLDGEDLIDYLPEDRAALGLVRSFQDCRLYPELTVEDTLMVAEDARRPVGVVGSTLRLPGARQSESAKRVAVDQLVAGFGLEAFRHRRIEQLSTGTRRVVDLATIVAARPRLLLLDEPTAGIAQREAEALAPLLRTLHQRTGATVMIVEHDVPMTVDICDRLVVMEAGGVVSAGPTAQVLRDPAAVEAYLGASHEALARSGEVADAPARSDP